MNSELEGPHESPFVTALGPALDKAAPVVKAHLTMDQPTALYSGFLRRIYRSGGPWTWFVAKALKLEDTRKRGEGRQSFELRNQLLDPHPGEYPTMVWNRISRNGSKTTNARGHMRWDPRYGVLIDSTGPWRCIDVELLPSVDSEGAVVLTSRRQWLRVMGCRFRLPRCFVGFAHTREWEEPEGKIGLSLTLSHPLLGEYAGYEAILEKRGTS